MRHKLKILLFWELLMVTKCMSFFMVVSAIVVSGCMNSASDATQPVSLPLDQKISAFEPPEKPPETISAVDNSG